MRAVAPLIVIALTSLLAAAEETASPPFEAGLGPGPVRVEVDVAELTVVVGYSPESRLLARVADGGLAAEGLLAIRAGGGGATIARRDPLDPDGGEEPPRLRLELELASGQRLAIRGRDLALQMTTAPLPEEVERSVVLNRDDDLEPGSAATPPASDETPAAAGASPIELTLTRSSAELTGISRPGVVAVDSDVRLSGCFGASSLQVSGGVSEVDDHHGSLTLSGQGAEITVVRSNGQVTATLAGGSLLARDGSGLVTAQLEDSLLQVEGWSGALALRGTGTAEVRRSAGATLSAVGQELNILADDWSGLVNAELDGGEIRGGDWSARADLTLRGGATADVDGVRNNVTLQAEVGCTADLRNVGGKLDATLNGARLDARGLGSLSLHGVDADVTLGEVTRLEKADAAHSTLDLDLSGIHSRLVVNLGREASATIRISTPCQVRTLGPGAALGNQARVSGCDYRIGNQRWITQPGRGLGGERPVQLVVTLAESASVDVDGVP